MRALGQAMNSRQLIVILVVAAAALALPEITGSFVVYVATYVMAMAAAALGYNIAYGFTGIISLGHSIMFGFGAYTMGILARSFTITTNGFLIFLTVLAVGCVLGAVVGFFASFVRGIYVVLVTLIFAEIAYLVIWVDPGGATGGESGIVGIRPASVTIPGTDIDIFRGIGLYYLALLLLALTLAVVKVLRDSQLGAVFQGIRENEDRVRSLGFGVRSYKVAAFALSGAVAAGGGYIVGALDNSASAGLVEWKVGAELLLICLVGGARTLWGPVIGAIIVGLVEHILRSYLAGNVAVYVLGVLYIVVMMWMRGGITCTRAAQAVGSWARRGIWRGPPATSGDSGEATSES
jgi:branched-chain amino acid transport system permease protein